MQERQVKDVTAEGGRDHVKRRHDVISIIRIIIEFRSQYWPTGAHLTQRQHHASPAERAVAAPARTAKNR